MRRWLGWLGFALALTGAEAAGHNSIGWRPLTPQSPPKKAAAPKLAPFVGTLDEARKEASERNVPLVIFAVLAKEEASERFANSVPGDPAVAAALDGTVLVIANAGDHPVKKLEDVVDGKKATRDVCSVFLTPTCAEHQRNWDPVFFAFNENGELRCPQVMLVTPDGKVARRLAPGEVPKASQLATALASQREKLGPGLSKAELDTVKAAQATAKKSLERDDHAEAWRAWAAVIAVNDKTRWADEARTGQARALEGLSGERDAALALLKGETPIEGYERLTALAARCKGLPNEKELAKLVTQAESTPATRDVIAAHKKKLAADALWKEVGELEAQNQKKKAEAKIRLLIRKYWDTEAGKQARKSYPEIAADEDKKGG